MRGNPIMESINNNNNHHPVYFRYRITNKELKYSHKIESLKEVFGAGAGKVIDSIRENGKFEDDVFIVKPTK
jgi:hypothetical protein